MFSLVREYSKRPKEGGDPLLESARWLTVFPFFTQADSTRCNLARWLLVKNGGNFVCRSNQL